MRPVYPSLILLAALIAAAPAVAQSQLPRPNQLPPPGGAPMQPPQARPPGPPPQAQPAPAPAKPYKPLAFAMPAPVNDPSFEAFRKQLGDVANRKDPAALARLVVAQGFFWDSENGDKADKKKSGVDNLAAALGGFGGRDASGWEALAAAAQDPTLEPSEDHKGAMCGPAGPTIDEQAFEALAKETGTEAGDWAFPTTPTLEVRAGAQPNAPIVERLGMHLVRVLPDAAPQASQQQQQQNAPQFVRVVTPSGKTAFVSEDTISPIGFDQICYVKDASGWKIAGYSGSQ